MDLAEKRRQLEEIRAAREAKQRSVLHQHGGTFIRKPSSVPIAPLGAGPAVRGGPSGSSSPLPHPRPLSEAQRPGTAPREPWPLALCVGPASVAPGSGSTPSAAEVPIDAEGLVAESRRTPAPDVSMMMARSLRAECVTDRLRCVHDIAILGTTDTLGVECLLVAAALSAAYVRDTPTATAVTDFDADGGGVVLLWAAPLASRALKSVGFVVPLKSFSGEVRCLTYARHRPNLLFGGTASGRVLVWHVDTALAALQEGRAVRVCADTLTPDRLSAAGVSVGRAVAQADASFPSPHAHHTRVMALAMRGDANYHHLYSVSEDGRVCMWSPLAIHQPASSCDAFISGQPLGWAGCCAAFVDKAADAMSRVFVGSSGGLVLEGRPKGSRAVELRPLPHAPHRAAVVAVAPHPLHTDPRVSDTTLTAAADGTCALWLGANHIAIDGFAAAAQCLRWSPTHSGVFAAGEANGRVAVWDLTRSAAAPAAFVHLRGHAVPGQGHGHGHGVSVTSLAFSEDGVWLACGDAEGEVHLLRLREDFVAERRGPHAARGGVAAEGEEAPAQHSTAAPSWVDARFVY